MTLQNKHGESKAVWVSRKGLINEKPAASECLTRAEAEVMADAIMDVLNPILGFTTPASMGDEDA